MKGYDEMKGSDEMTGYAEMGGAQLNGYDHVKGTCKDAHGYDPNFF